MAQFNVKLSDYIAKLFINPTEYHNPIEYYFDKENYILILALAIYIVYC